MKIVLVRHGISEFNVLERTDNPYFCGASNIPLAESGRKMAKELRNNEVIKSIQKAYSSTLQRANETARLAMPEIDIIQTDALNERGLGIFENRPEKEVKEEYKEFFQKYGTKFRHDFIIKAPGGENYTDVCNRLKKFLSTLDLTSDEVISIFSHFHLSRCLIYILTDISEEDIMKLKIPHCTPIVLEGKELGKFKVISENINNFMV